jgi:hypothetical protein
MRCIVFALALAMPATALAQRLAPVGVRVDQTAAALRTEGAPRREAAMSGLPLRMLLGVGSAFGGAYAGALTTLALPHSDCNCDDPGLREAIVGAMVGSVLVPAVVSAIPELSSECSFARRTGIGILGGVAGAAIGGVLGASVAPGGGVVVGYVGGAGLGAALGTGLCRG